MPIDKFEILYKHNIPLPGRNLGEGFHIISLLQFAQAVPQFLELIKTEHGSVGHEDAQDHCADCVIPHDRDLQDRGCDKEGQHGYCDGDHENHDVRRHGDQTLNDLRDDVDGQDQHIQCQQQIGCVVHDGVENGIDTFSA